MMRIEGRGARRQGLWVWLVGVAGAVSGSVSYGQSLEELEQQLKKEQAAEQRRQAAEQQRKAAEAKRQASMGTLVLRSDAACELSIDGTSKGALEAATPRTVQVVGGQQLIECVSPEEPAVRYERILEVSAGAKQVVTLALADAVGQQRQARQERERAEAKQRAERAALEPRRAELQARFEPASDGVRDRQLGVVWAARDNGSKVTWYKAQAYCAGLGAGWTLPSVTELLSLYDESGAFAQQASGFAIQPATDQIGFTGYWYWSAEWSATPYAWCVSFHAGGGGRVGGVRNLPRAQALCVRRS